MVTLVYLDCLDLLVNLVLQGHRVAPAQTGCLALLGLLVHLDLLVLQVFLAHLVYKD